VRTILRFLRARARREGVAKVRSGAVAIIQRFGGALNLNVHIHALVIDGVFAQDGETLRFPHAGRRGRCRGGRRAADRPAAAAACPPAAK
jgi:hypothetical protein